MIFNEDFLFLHIPKTGGMSLSHALVKCLKGQVYNTLPDGHGNHLADEIILPGKRHETLTEAQKFFLERKKNLADFRMILAVIRNPYDLEVSRYHYLRKGYEFDRGIEQDIAIKSNFEDFSLKANCWFDVKKYLTLEGIKPDNMVVVRFENLESEIRYYCSPFLKGFLEFPKINYTERDQFQSYLTPEVEKAIYRKYKWVFESGFYSRFDFNSSSINIGGNIYSLMRRLKNIVSRN